MPKHKATPDPFAASPAAVDMLRQAQWTCGAVDGPEVYELRLKLASPAVTTPAKADIPVPGLPTLDGFLSFVAFRAALNGALKMHPESAGELLWQWNAALREPTCWVEFPLPLRQVTLGTAQIYDCSIGLPVVKGHILIPAGAFFARGQDLVTYPEVVDSLPLRRRVAPPYPRPMSLTSDLNTGSGKNKALDNRMYYSLTDEFAFYFRGDPAGVQRLLQFACEQRIGIGKKTTLGYGLLAGYAVASATTQATLAQPILDGLTLALLKTLPHDVALTIRDKAEQDLFNCSAFRLMNAIETLGAYRPPYWRREAQVQVLLYGTTLIRKMI
jgi:hypothetical protein